MTEEQKKTIQEYTVIFKNLMAPYLKPNVAIATTIYPFSCGVVLLFQFNKDADTKTEFMPEVDSLQNVVATYNIDLKGNDLDKLQEKHSIIFSGRSIVSVKNYNENSWTEKRAESIVKRIITIIGEKICKSK
ncbi:MAG: hypothetical protein HDS35_10950 [Bacteroides sp.]|nr:hypothetical protein [Bacteroides sp.]